MTVVLDADVLIGVLDGSDPHHDAARNLFAGWRANDEPRVIRLVNLSEVLVAPAGQATQLRRAREAIAALGVAVHRPTETIAVAAARLRGKHPISLADAYCIATAGIFPLRLHRSTAKSIARQKPSESRAADPRTLRSELAARRAGERQRNHESDIFMRRTYTCMYADDDRAR